jgi:hypothetical protein
MNGEELDGEASEWWRGTGRGSQHGRGFDCLASEECRDRPLNDIRRTPLSVEAASDFLRACTEDGFVLLMTKASESSSDDGSGS